MDGLGRRLRQARNLTGLTLEVVADQAGMTRQWLGALECGRAAARVEQVEAIHRVLEVRVPGISLVWLLTGEGEAGRVEDHVDRRQLLKRAAAVAPSTLLPMIADLERMAAPVLDGPLLEIYRAKVWAAARARPIQAPNELLPELEHLVGVLQARVLDRRGPAALQDDLLSIAAGASALCGWTHTMVAHRPEARAYLDYSERLAREAGDDETLALVLMLQADVMSPVQSGGVTGSAEAARSRLQEARSRLSPAAPVPLAASIHLRAAEEAAWLGQETEARHLLEAGAAAAETAPSGVYPLRPVWPSWAVESWHGSCAQLLGHPQEAIEALEGIQSDFPAHRPMLAADLGAAHAQAGDPDEAARILATAIEQAIENGYVRAGRRIAGVRRRHLAGRDDMPAVQQLDERIAIIL